MRFDPLHTLPLLGLSVLAGLVGCAHARPPERVRDGCEEGRASDCASLGRSLGALGDREGAERAYDLACHDGASDACIAEGRLRMERGELDGAQEPLNRAYDADKADGYDALADLHDLRGTPQDHDAALRLRFEGLAIEQPPVEVIWGFRAQLAPAPIAPTAETIAVNVQPMAFAARRLSVGTLLGFGAAGLTEVDGSVSYQHFLTSWAIPYTTVFLGALTFTPPRERLNAGVDVGLKVGWGPVGHLNLSVGSSRGSPLHAGIGLGLNYELVLLALLLAG